MVFAIVALLGAVLGCRWRVPLLPQAAAVVVLNLAIAEAWGGLPYQWPEAIWTLDADAPGFFKLAPLQQCPVPSY